MTARIMPTALACLAMALLSACSTETSQTNPITCAGVATPCGNTCVVTASDPANCGACGQACDLGQVCVEGACGSACPEAQVDCDGTCVSPESDPEHCGASGDCRGANAGWRCGVGELCVDAACSATCPDGQIACGGFCISPATDRKHCGATADCTGADAGVVCEPSDQCVDGACMLVCPEERIACEDACISPGTNRRFCGASGDCLGENAGVTCEESETCKDGICKSPECEADSECDDGVFCNGEEICFPGDPNADAFGCMQGQTPCKDGVECNEEAKSC